MNRPWWDEAGLRGADGAGAGSGEAGGLGDRAGELKVGRSSEASRPPHAAQNRPAAGTSVPHFRQRTTIASAIELGKLQSTSRQRRGRGGRAGHARSIKDV